MKENKKIGEKSCSKSKIYITTIFSDHNYNRLQHRSIVRMVDYKYNYIENNQILPNIKMNSYIFKIKCKILEIFHSFKVLRACHNLFLIHLFFL